MSAGRAIRLTARREVRERLRSRAFQASVAIQIVIVLLIVVISALSGGDDTKDYDVGARESTALLDRLSSRSIADVSITIEDPRVKPTRRIASATASSTPPSSTPPSSPLPTPTES